MNERIKQMVDPQGFDNLFYQEVGKGKTHKQAFRCLNKEYKDFFGRKRYANYDSYRLAKRQRLKT